MYFKLLSEISDVETFARGERLREINRLRRLYGAGRWRKEDSMTPKSGRKYSVCVRNTGYAASLELRKLYVIVPDGEALKHRLVRVIDETGEDFLYPEKWFVPVELSPAARRALRASARRYAA